MPFFDDWGLGGVKYGHRWQSARRVEVVASTDRADEQGGAHHTPRRGLDVLPIPPVRSQDLKDLSNMNSARGALNRGISMSAFKKPVHGWRRRGLLLQPREIKRH